MITVEVKGRDPKFTWEIVDINIKVECKCWPEFYKYVKRRKGYRENIPAIKDCNGRHIIDLIQRANSLNYYYSSVFSSKGNIQHIQCANSGEPFIIDRKIIRKRVAAIGKKQIRRARRYFWRNPKTGWEAMIPYLARLLDITNNDTLPADWKMAIVVPVHIDH
jgi:hypothetical protein